MAIKLVQISYMFLYCVFSKSEYYITIKFCLFNSSLYFWGYGHSLRCPDISWGSADGHKACGCSTDQTQVLDLI